MAKPLDIAQNTTYLTVALVFQKVIAFFFFLLIARTLGQGGTGDYVAAFAFSSFFSIFIDLGLSQVLIREIARDPTSTERYIGSVMALKLPLSVLVYAALLGTIFVLEIIGASHPPFITVALAGVIMMVDSFTLTGMSIFRGWHNLWFESAITVINKIAVIGLGFLVLKFWPSPSYVAVVLLLGSTLSFGILTYYLRSRLTHVWRPQWDAVTVRKLARLAAPFALASFFAASYAQLDSILLSTLQGSHSVGLYSIASKTMNAFAFIPAAFAAALYPVMSHDFFNAPERLAGTLERALRFLLIISVPIAAGLFVLAHEFVGQLGADYLPAVLAVRILLPSLIFVFLSFPLGSLLNASNHQHWQTAIIGGGTALNLLLNIFLIPRFSFIGASIAWLATNAVILIAGFIAARFVVQYPWRPFLGSICRVVGAAAVMTYIIQTLYSGMLGDAAITLGSIKLFGLVFVGAFIYGGILLLTREVTLSELKELWHSLSARRGAGVSES